jgi:hypothetical protein
VRDQDPFQPDDLLELGGFFDRATRVVAMEDVFDGEHDPGVIGLRHDCDNVILPAVDMAAWEAARGIRATYYILHTAPYWEDKTLLRRSLERIAECGHEIGIHNDAITVALETGRDAAEVLHEAVAELRGYGHTIRSTVAHGNALCGVHRYVNDELFSECRRKVYGDISRLNISTYPLAAFDLDFDANWLRRGDYLSDSGGEWSQPFDTVAAAWPARGQLHMLLHPDWWAQAFQPETVAA